MPLRDPSTGAFSASYDLLARAYLDGPRALGVTVRPAPDALVEALGGLDPGLSGLLRALLLDSEVECVRAEEAHAACFGLPLPGRYVPPVASVYLDGGLLWGPSTRAVLDLYEAEGLSWNRGRRGPGGVAISSPDHVGVEMAFLAVTSSRHPSARRAARIDAMLAHLHTWLPRLIDALGDARMADYPGRLTAFGLAAVEIHRRRRGATPPAPPRRRAP